MIQRDEFFAAISDLKMAHREMRDELMSITRDIRDRVAVQNGRVRDTEKEVAVLQEKVGNLSSSIKDSTARWLGISGMIIAGLLELVQFVSAHKGP